LGKNILNLKKLPRLPELYEKLFLKNIEEKHRALEDAEIYRECYYKINEIFPHEKI